LPVEKKKLEAEACDAKTDAPKLISNMSLKALLLVTCLAPPTRERALWQAVDQPSRGGVAAAPPPGG